MGPHCSTQPYLGGTNRNELANAIAVDASGQIYVTGHTSSTDFPVTTNAFDTTVNGSNDVMVAVLNSAGSGLDLVATYLGAAAPNTATVSMSTRRAIFI